MFENLIFLKISNYEIQILAFSFLIFGPPAYFEWIQMDFF